MSNAAMSVSAASASATFVADEIVVASALGASAYRLPVFNKTVNLATVGAGGMDTGAAPASGYVALYAIYNPVTGISALLAVNATASAAPSVYGGANMPAGYTASALVSVWPTNSSSQFVTGLQRDRKIARGVVNVYSSTSPPSSVTPLSLSSVVPKNAVGVSGFMGLAAATSASSYGISVYADAQGSDLQSLACYSPAGASSNSPFSISISSAQTMYFNNSGVPTSGCTWAINISGYSF
jgi:hypothetical protein